MNTYQIVPQEQIDLLLEGVDKAARYATEKDRILINGFTVSIRGNNGDHSVSYDNGAWNCDSNSFRMRGVSSHTIAMERLLKGMLPEAQKV